MDDELNEEVEESGSQEEANEDIEIVDIHVQSQQRAGIPDSKGDSYNSYGMDTINIPEVSDVKSEFIYNYFTPDERVRKGSNTTLDIDMDYTDDILYRIQNDKLPRYVTVSFKSPNVSGDVLAFNKDNIVIENNLHTLIIEGAASNSYYTGIEFIDTNKELNIYTLLSSSLFFLGISDPKDSPKDKANKLYQALSSGGLFGENKRLLSDALGNMTPEGITFAPSDVRPEEADLSSDPITKQTVGVKFNNLLITEMVNNATRIPDTVFQDEMKALDSHTQSIYSKILGTISSENLADVVDYEMLVEAYDSIPITTSLDQAYDHYPIISIVGYIVQKFEVLRDGTTSFQGVLYSRDPTGLSVVDKNVRYGGNYIYKVRTICRVQAIAQEHDPEDESQSQNVIASMLMASKGVITDVLCVEKVPPPPPTNLRVSFNFRKKIPYLTWQFPVNPQRDIKRFQIFKRLSVREPFTLIAEYDFDNSLIRGRVKENAISENLYRFKRPRISYLDTSYVQGERPIYAIASVDAHGMSSEYSMQIQVEYDKYKNKVNTSMISPPNAPKPYPNVYLNMDAFQDAMKVSNYNRMKIFFDPEYYKVVQNVGGGHIDGQETEESLDFLRVNPEEASYTIQILNMDLQKDHLLKVKLTDKSGLPQSRDLKEMSAENLNFEFGLN